MSPDRKSSPWVRETRKTLGYLRRHGPLGAAQRVMWDRTIGGTIFSRSFDFVASIIQALPRADACGAELQRGRIINPVIVSA